MRQSAKAFGWPPLLSASLVEEKLVRRRFYSDCATVNEGSEVEGRSGPEVQRKFDSLGFFAGGCSFSTKLTRKLYDQRVFQIIQVTSIEYTNARKLFEGTGQVPTNLHCPSNSSG